MDEPEFQLHQKEQFEEYEAICKHCGACCGAYDGDPCANLIRHVDGKYLCSDYENRFRQQITVSGKKFHCIPIREVIAHAGARPNCAYVDSIL